MKLTSVQKKMILLSLAVVVMFTATGCRVPTDSTGAIKQITNTTTFQDVMSSENWFSAVLVWPIAWLINNMTPHIGVAAAITVVTLLVNLILLAFTVKSTVASQQMQLIQPEMTRIQKKYEGKTDDASRMKQATEMQALYKKYNVNPFSTILITFLQFPIIIAMYQAVERASAVKTGSFLGMSMETTPWNGIKAGQWTYLLVFLVMIGCQYLSMKLPQYLAQKRENLNAEQQHRKPVNLKEQNAQQNSMMLYMMVPVLVIGIMLPTAMTIYWAINSLVAIGKTYLVQTVFIDKKKKKEGQAA